MSPESLFQQHQKLAENLAKKYKSSSVNSDDLKQEALLALWNAALKYDPDRGTFDRFADFTIRAALKKYRRKEVAFQKRHLDVDPDELTSFFNPDNQILARELIDSLPEPGRTILTMRAEGIPIKDIAKQMDLSGRRIMQLLKECRVIIEEQLNTED